MWGVRPRLSLPQEKCTAREFRPLRTRQIWRSAARRSPPHRSHPRRVAESPCRALFPCSRMRSQRSAAPALRWAQKARKPRATPRRRRILFAWMQTSWRTALCCRCRCRCFLEHCRPPPDFGFRRCWPPLCRSQHRQPRGHWYWRCPARCLRHAAPSACSPHTHTQTQTHAWRLLAACRRSLCPTLPLVSRKQRPLWRRRPGCRGRSLCSSTCIARRLSCRWPSRHRRQVKMHMYVPTCQRCRWTAEFAPPSARTASRADEQWRRLRMLELHVASPIGPPLQAD